MQFYAFLIGKRKSNGFSLMVKYLPQFFLCVFLFTFAQAQQIAQPHAP
jgi:hypothetical protein